MAAPGWGLPLPEHPALLEPSVLALAVNPLLPGDGLREHWGPGRTPFAAGASVCTLEAWSRPSSGQAEPAACLSTHPVSGPRLA